MPSPVVPCMSPYGSFQGTLFQYKTFPSLVAFESNPPVTPSCPNKCILIGGLGDGLIPTPYTKDLERICHESGWSLVQPILSSSGMGFGHGTLSRDTDELCDLMTYLIHHHDAQNFTFVGHSTGCQNSVHFMKYAKEKNLISRVKLIALQAPVSDREAATLGPQIDKNIEHAKRLQERGEEDEMMPRNAFWAPLTARRYLSLLEFGGEDDFFSSDYEDRELCLRLRHLGQTGGLTGLKVLVAYSGGDEYVPSFVDKDILLQRLCGAINSGSESETAIPLMLKTGNHNLSNGESDKDIFVAAVRDLLSNIVH